MNSQHKVRLSKVLLMLCLSAAMVMGSMPCKPFVMEVKADTPAEKTITGLGLGTIMTKPNEPKERPEDWSGSHVYFGKYAGNPMKYRVLACSENMILLDCDDILKDIKFSTNNNNNWKESEVRSWLQGDEFYNNTDVFTAAEKNAIHAGNKEIEGINDVTIPEGYTIVDLEEPDPVFVLNVSAVTNSRLGYYNDTDWSNTRQKKLLDSTASKRVAWWWLRSTGKDQIDGYDSVGTVYGTKVRALSVIDEWVGVSPALYLDTAPILYSSLVNGSEGQAGSGYKLTVKDEGLSVSYNNVEGEDDRISVSYTFEDNSESADPTQISVVVTDKAWDSETKLNEINVIQYTKLAMDSFGSSGTGTFTLDPNPTGTWGKDYHVYILAEDVNGEHETDYASPPVEIGRDSSAVWASAKNQEFTYDGMPHGITVNVTHPARGVTVKYGESADNCTLDTCPTITNVSDSPKIIYYEAKAEGFTTAEGSATVTINRAESAIKKAPSAKTGLKYTGQAQALVNAGTATGGTLYYAVTTGTAAPAGLAYTAAVPQKTDAGSYTVWYKVIGDENHYDSEAGYLSVIINEKRNEPTEESGEGSEEGQKEDPGEGSKDDPVITPSDNKAMDVRTENAGDFRVTYAHQVTFPGKAKLALESFGEVFTVSAGDTTYKVKKIKVNQKKKKIQIVKLENAPKDVEKAVKKETKGDKGMPYTQNPYYVKNTDSVKPKLKKNGNLASVKIGINGKDYKAKKNELEYDKDSRVITFKGENLAGAYVVP